MTIDTVADEFDDIGEVEAPKRRDRPVKAQPAEPVPPEINSAFLEDLAFERALSMALGLASGVSGAVDGLGGVRGPDGPSELATAVKQPAEAALCALDRAGSTAHDLAL